MKHEHSNNCIRDYRLFSFEKLRLSIHCIQGCRYDYSNGIAFNRQSFAIALLESGIVPSSPAFTVLLVEDDVLIRMNTAELLKELGYDVLEASNAAEALKALKDQTIDVLFTDLTLPGMSGADLAIEAHHMQPSLDIIFATGNDTAPEMPEGINPILLRKPYGTGAIITALSAARDVS